MKITESDAYAIRFAHENTQLNQREIGEVFGIGKTQVNNILCGVRWSNFYRPQQGHAMQHKCREDTVMSRFSSKYSVDGRTGCWNWTASVRDNGYGQMQTHKKVERAHRVSWEIHRGEIPDGMFVLHRCDNRLCVNPDHLYLGTHADNMRDITERGRSSKGIFHYKRRLACYSVTPQAQGEASDDEG